MTPYLVLLFYKTDILVKVLLNLMHGKEKMKLIYFPDPKTPKNLNMEILVRKTAFHILRNKQENYSI